MSSMLKSSAAHAGQLHRYASRLVAFEHAAATNNPKHTLLFMGGLSDGLLTVSYPSFLAKNAPANWSVVEVLTTSSLNGWGTSSLTRDAMELAQCVAYFRKIRPQDGKIILMGHSTGCQDALEYVTGKDNKSRSPLDGAIIQAPVSDREAFQRGGTESRKEYDELVEAAQKQAAAGQLDEVMPNKYGRKWFGRTAITAYRWLSLLSPNHDGDDDYFSSDLSDEQISRTFGKFPKETPLLILWSGKDEHVPKDLDPQKLIARWTNTVKQGGGYVDEKNSGIVDGASHNLDGNDESIIINLLTRVSSFLQSVDSNHFQETSSQL